MILTRATRASSGGTEAGLIRCVSGGRVGFLHHSFDYGVITMRKSVATIIPIKSR